ncbi:hypothetical protein IMSAGC020_00924 [Lachnospiraceae bacterium]|nr:hypothetical protein IMSAGC020_00924 [Lachnospiraceae bacterium]
MNKISLKKYLVDALSVLPNSKPLSDNDLIFVTPTGLIYGKPVSSDSSNIPSDINFPIDEICQHISSTYFDTFSCTESDLENHDGYLILTDVKVVSSGQVLFKHEFMVLFYDQIIGVTLGHPEF